MSVAVGVVCDGLSTTGVRLTTLVVTCPLAIAQQLKTLRALSVTSPFATLPADQEVKRLIEYARVDPALPRLRDHGSIDEFSLKRTNMVWLQARDAVCEKIEYWSTVKHTPSIELAQRLLAPWLHTSVIVSATEWDELLSANARTDFGEEITDVVAHVTAALDRSKPNTLEPGQWYIPFVGMGDIEDLALAAFADSGTIPVDQKRLEGRVTELTFRLSASRLARYANGDATPMHIGDELKFYKPMYNSRAIFPYLEHIATPDFRADHTGWWASPHQHGNFIGWRQHRKSFIGETKASNRR